MRNLSRTSTWPVGPATVMPLSSRSNVALEPEGSCARNASAQMTEAVSCA